MYKSKFTEIINLTNSNIHPKDDSKSYDQYSFDSGLDLFIYKDNTFSLSFKKTPIIEGNIDDKKTVKSAKLNQKALQKLIKETE